MQVIDIYDFDKNGDERYAGTNFCYGEGEVVKSYGYSYLLCREMYRKRGQEMGLDKLLIIDTDEGDELSE